jgi:hypothetical protein
MWTSAAARHRTGAQVSRRAFSGFMSYFAAPQDRIRAIAEGFLLLLR